MTGGVGAESQALMLDMRSRRSTAVQSMTQPRREVSIHNDDTVLPEIL